MLHIAGRFEPGDKTVLGRRIGAERSGPRRSATRSTSCSNTRTPGPSSAAS
jgi:hypothetical protein